MILRFPPLSPVYHVSLYCYRIKQSFLLVGIRYNIHMTIRREQVCIMPNKSIQAFFTEYAPPIFSTVLVKRTAKQLRRHGIETMDALCMISIENLKKIRNIGEKSLKIAVYMREKYSEQSITCS